MSFKFTDGTNGVSPADIVIQKSHSQDAADKYIKYYDQIKRLLKKGLNEETTASITGRSLNVIR